MADMKRRTEMTEGWLEAALERVRKRLDLFLRDPFPDGLRGVNLALEHYLDVAAEGERLEVDVKGAIGRLLDQEEVPDE